MARLISLLVLLEVLVVPAQFAHPQPTDSAPEGDGTTTGDPQAADTEGVPNDDLDLGTDVITPTRSLTPLFETPYSSDVVGARLKEHQYRTLPEALRDVPGAMVQKTGHGQGSPFIRGFTGFRTLLMIDGVRVNNSVFRSGPNQYWATVDPFSLWRIEVIRGPASVQYGSDAVGGAVNALTLSPRLEGEDRSTGGRLYVRGASAENSVIGRGEVDATIRNERFGILGGLTGKLFGDLEGGDHVGKQENTAYDEYAGDAKAIFRVGDDHRLIFLYQKLRQNDAPRTHRTQDAIFWQSLTQGSDLQRDFDQERDLSYLQLHANDLNDVIDSFKVSMSWQRQQEERDRTSSSGSRSQQGFDVNTYGVWVQSFSSTTLGEITAGAEWYHDEVDSFSSANTIQGPVGDDATYDLIGVFVQDQIPVGEQVDFTFGGRFTYAHADVGQLQDFGTGNPIGFRDDYSALTGSARAQVFLDSERRFSIFGGASQAFRAPNLSDVSRLDDFGTDGFEIPATNLDPEEFTQLEIGVKSDTEFAQVQAAYYYTLIDNLILRVPSGPNPTDPSQTLFVKQNSGDGYVQGVEVGARIRLFPSVSLFGTFGWQEGEVDFVNNSNQVERDDLSRLLPTSGIVGLRYDDPQEDLFLELVANLADQQDNLSVRDRSDTSRIPPNGTPGYAVYSIRSGWEFNEDVTLFAAVENLLDEDYRIHGSGVNEPGRNFVFSAEYRF